VLVTVLSLGIGIGLTTSVFAVGNAFLLQSPGGLTNTDGLVALYTSDEEGRLYDATSYPDVEDMAREANVFEAVTAIRPGVVRWTEGEASRRVLVEIVNGNYFHTLGVTLPLGRPFAPEETEVGSAQPVTVVSYEFWQRRFGGDPSVLGRTIRLDDRSFTIIGVAPEGLLGRFLRLKVDAWVPLGLPGGIYHSTPKELVDRTAREYMVYGRLQPGLSVPQAQARLNVLASRLHEEYPSAWVDDHGTARKLTVLSEKDARVRPDMRAALAAGTAFLLAGAGFVLLIACVNVAGLFLARALKRRREIAIRLSLGAGRVRVVRLLLVEALLLALAGGGVGVGIASATARFLSAIPFPLDVPLSFDVGIDARVLLFALGTALATCLLFGLVPALRASRPDLVGVLKGAESESGRRRFSLRGGLVVLQVGASLVLLVGTGLCLRSSGALASLDPGLHPDGIALASWRETKDGVGEEGGRQEILSLLERVSASPEIGDAAVASAAELSAWVASSSAKVLVDGYAAPPDQEPVVGSNVVTPGYFEMLGMRPIRGRTLRPSDNAGAANVALVNETFVRTFWPGESGLGRRFTILERRAFGKPSAYRPREVTVVGVLRDVRVAPDQDAEPYFWTSFLQDYTPMVVFHARGRTGAAPAVPELRRIVQDDPNELPLVSAQTYADLIAFNTMGQRIAVKAFAWTGSFALLLALMGIYGIVSFAVSQRMREMAIRQGLARAAVPCSRPSSWTG
jgi:predicted permease